VIEEKLWGILQKLDANNDNVSQICEDWWEVSQECMSMNSLTEYFSDENHKDVLRRAALCEL
jgi:hypothetical protein